MERPKTERLKLGALFRIPAVHSKEIRPETGSPVSSSFAIPPLTTRLYLTTELYIIYHGFHFLSIEKTEWKNFPKEFPSRNEVVIRKKWTGKFPGRQASFTLCFSVREKEEKHQKKLGRQ